MNKNVEARVWSTPKSGSRISTSPLTSFGLLRSGQLQMGVLGALVAVILLWPQIAAADEGASKSINSLAMGVGLLGGLALFLYGMEKMTDGLKAAAGEQMKMLLTKLTRNAVTGALTGAVVTAVIQSSSVTTVLVVGFVSAGLMTLVQSVGVIIGANVGTTVTAQIVAFNVTAAALPLITIGFCMIFIGKNSRARYYGDMLMGLGLIFYGMAAMGDAMSPLRTHEGFIELMRSMERPILGMLIGALFTALVQSSSATIGLVVVMGTQGFVTLPAGIAIVFGAKIGTCVTALLAALGKPQDALRAAAVHVIYNVLGAAIWIAFIDQLASLAVWVSASYPELQGVERLAREVPRQIANAASIWAVANMVIFLPFSVLLARLVCRLVPEREVAATAIVKPKFLDKELVRVPSLALERARLELGHMAERVDQMLTDVPAAFQKRNFREITQNHDQVVVLREAILKYLQHVGRENLTDVESDELSQLVSATSEIESISTVIGRELAPISDAFRDKGLTVSEATGALLVQLYEATREAARAGLRAIVDKDERAAQGVVARRDKLWALGNTLLQQQAARLAKDDPQRLLKHRVQVDLLDKMRRIYGVAEHMAISVLPRGVLAGELAA
ncbi:MAG: Na/Pi cotransporter family protein [Deltaproteobacteria bacterium]|nr:Na/Pi cotransporter family protein [Deltaproteobacteria bacterium]